MYVRDLLRTRVLRYTAIAVMAFTVGSASVVLAASSGAMQLPVFRLADGTNPDQFAKVDAAGNVQVSVNNPPQTQQISGTVSVSNFPTTQNVNVTAGTVLTKPSVATRAIRPSLLMEAGESASESFTAINASFIAIHTSDDMQVFVFGSIGDILLPNNREMSFTQRVPVNGIRANCFNILLDCAVFLTIIGD
jgi:hypothetical protein